MGRSMLRPYKKKQIPRLARNDGIGVRSESYACAVALFVLLAGAAGARFVAADLGAGAHGLGRFGLRGTGLILQIALVALLAALDFARNARQMLRLAGACGGAGDGRICTWAHRLRRRRGLACPLRGRLLALLHLDVEEIANRFVVDARHHVFEKDEGFFLEFDERIFLPVAAKADAFLQVVEREKVVFPL